MEDSPSNAPLSEKLPSYIIILLIWEHPIVSAVTLVTLNFIFWFFVFWNRRLIPTIAIIFLITFLARHFQACVWPEIRAPTEGEDTESWTTVNPRVLSAPELSHYLNEFWDRCIALWHFMLQLRKENHGLFCLIGTVFFGVLALVGRVIPGVVLVYFLVLLFTLGPGIMLHLVPPSFYEQLIGFFTVLENEGQEVAKTASRPDHDSDLDDFIPESSPEIISQLSLQEESPDMPSIGAVLTDPSDLDPDIREMGFESYVSGEEFSLYQGLGAFPSVEEENESDLEESNSENILPKLEPEQSGDMHFVPTHFKEDSSESASDAAFTEGLSFDGPTAAKEAASNNPATSKKAAEDTQKARKISTSSDIDFELMDFEMLEESDIPT